MRLIVTGRRGSILNTAKRVGAAVMRQEELPDQDEWSAMKGHEHQVEIVAVVIDPAKTAMMNWCEVEGVDDVFESTVFIA